MNFKSRIKTIAGSLLLGGLLTHPAGAQVTPVPFSGDARLVRVAYQENNVVPLKGQLFTSTQVVFGIHERVINVDGGDRAGWIVTHQDNLPNMLFIKPTLKGSDSNITAVTTRHTYYFHVTSNKNLHDAAKPVYAMKFFYPEEERVQLKASREAQHRHREATRQTNKHPKTYNWNYSFNGSPELKPLHVFDDGVFTYFELQANQSIPAVFVVDNQHGEEAVSNIRRQGAYLVVHRIAPQFTLRRGTNHVASVFNQAAINRLKTGSTA